MQINEGMDAYWNITSPCILLWFWLLHASVYD